MNLAVYQGTIVGQAWAQDFDFWRMCFILQGGTSTQTQTPLVRLIASSKTRLWSALGLTCPASWLLRDSLGRTFVGLNHWAVIADENYYFFSIGVHFSLSLAELSRLINSIRNAQSHCALSEWKSTIRNIPEIPSIIIDYTYSVYSSFPLWCTRISIHYFCTAANLVGKFLKINLLPSFKFVFAQKVVLDSR